LKFLAKAGARVLNSINNDTIKTTTVIFLIFSHLPPKL
jgi:hypothetical protein